MSKRQPVFRTDKLVTKFPELQSEAAEDPLVSVVAAIEELYAAVEKLSSTLRFKEAALHPGDYNGMLEMATDLRELFEHLTEHCQESSSALWQLSDIITSKLGQSDRKEGGA